MNFIETYYKIFEEFEAQEYHIFTEVNYSGEQCNFEILSISLLKRLSLLNLFYCFPRKCIQNEEKGNKAFIKQINALGIITFRSYYSYNIKIR